MKRTFLFCALLALLTGANAQETTDYKEKHPYKDWVKIAPKLDDAFFTTPEAIRIADNVLPTNDRRLAQEHLYARRTDGR